MIFFIAAGFIFYISNQNKSKEAEIEKSSKIIFDVSPIKFYVENCIEDTAKNALIHIGKHGGYYQLKKPYLIDENFKLPYYVVENLDFSPSLNVIQNEISKYIDNNLPICINNFEEFKNQGFEIIQEEIKSDINIELNSISFNVNFPITIKKDDTIQEIKNFKVRIEQIPLSSIHKVSREITKLQLQEPTSVCLSCLYGLGEKSNLYIDIVEYKNNTLIFDVRAYNTSIIFPEEFPYNFTFAAKYPEVSCDNLGLVDDFIFLNECLEAKKKELSNEIIIEDIPNFEIQAGEEFFYDINATGKNFVFEDFTNLFDIDKISGIIRFTPKNEEIGLHQIWIRAFDSIGNEDYENFKINIMK